jgi:hypothetical protein
MLAQIGVEKSMQVIELGSVGRLVNKNWPMLQLGVGRSGVADALSFTRLPRSDRSGPFAARPPKAAVKT